MKILAPLGGLLGVLMLCGCNTLAGIPEIRRTAISPETLYPGDTAIITLEIKDRESIVKRVEGVVKDDPRITFRLQDDGVDPDLIAADGIWTLRVDVPAAATEGEYALEFTAYDEDGYPVEVHDAAKNVVPLRDALSVIIRYREE